MQGTSYTTNCRGAHASRTDLARPCRHHPSSTHLPCAGSPGGGAPPERDSCALGSAHRRKRSATHGQHPHPRYPPAVCWFPRRGRSTRARCGPGPGSARHAAGKGRGATRVRWVWVRWVHAAVAAGCSAVGAQIGAPLSDARCVLTLRIRKSARQASAPSLVCSPTTAQPGSARTVALTGKPSSRGTPSLVTMLPSRCCTSSRPSIVCKWRRGRREGDGCGGVWRLARRVGRCVRHQALCADALDRFQVCVVARERGRALLRLPVAPQASPSIVKDTSTTSLVPLWQASGARREGFWGRSWKEPLPGPRLAK